MRTDGPELTLRFAPELRFFLPPRHRGEQVRLLHDRTSSLGHLVQSLGVPLTEVGRLRAAGRTVTPSHRPGAGEVIDISAQPRPQPLPRTPPRFLLDVHLGTLARRLRLLGVDTAYDNDRDDDALIEQANAQERILLTRDRALLRRRSLHLGGHVRSDRPQEQLTDVLERFAPPLAPWTRCMSCNGTLVQVPKAEVQDRIEAGTRATYQAFARCRGCGRVYWPGAHHRRLTQIVAAAERHAPEIRPGRARGS